MAHSQWIELQLLVLQAVFIAAIILIKKLSKFVDENRKYVNLSRPFFWYMIVSTCRNSRRVFLKVTTLDLLTSKLNCRTQGSKRKVQK